MEKLTDLPPWAVVVFGVTLAVIFGIRHLGLWQGERAAPSASPTAAQVAAVIVDPAALNAATAALREHNEVSRDLIDVVELGAKNIGHMATELDRIREELRIQREVRRSVDR